jgi:hypothetical protein
MAGLQQAFVNLNRHYEVWWGESGCRSCCQHRHYAIIEAVNCGMAQKAGWYVIAVEYGIPRQLTIEEDDVIGQLQRSRCL